MKRKQRYHPLPVNFAPTKERPIGDYFEADAVGIELHLMQLTETAWQDGKSHANPYRPTLRGLDPLDLAVFILMKLKTAGEYDATVADIASAFNVEPRHVTTIYRQTTALLQPPKPK